VWEATRQGQEGLEFFILSPEETPRHVETLAMLAHMHADEKYRKKLGDVVKIGWPWLENGRCDRFLVSLPYPYGPSLEWCILAERHIRFLWLLPIHESEEAYLRTHGQEALERLFDENKINSVQRDRPSVV
jgi:hypothetical protein